MRSIFDSTPTVQMSSALCELGQEWERWAEVVDMASAVFRPGWQRTVRRTVSKRRLDAKLDAHLFRFLADSARGAGVSFQENLHIAPCSSRLAAMPKRLLESCLYMRPLGLHSIFCIHMSLV